MNKTSSIAWVLNGGEVDFIGHENLIYNSVEDAARKILRVLGVDERQSSLLQRFVGKGGLFFAARFMSDMRWVVREFMEPVRSEDR